MRGLSLFIITLYCLLISAQPDLCPKMRHKIQAQQFAVDYSIQYKIPLTVYYVVHGDSLGDYGRYYFTNNFYPDAAGYWDYYGSGYDKGHMFPAGSAESIIKMIESFDMINMIPQQPSFNRGVWKQIENFERRNSYPYVYVICGVVTLKTGKLLNDRVAVPNTFYKVLYNPTYNRMIAFIVSQDTYDSYINHVVTVDQVEKLIGKDLFYQLNTKLQKQLESKSNIKYWK